MAKLGKTLAYLVFRKNPHSITHKLLAYLSFTTILWTITNFFSLLPSSPEIMLFWVRMVMFVTTPYGTTILLLSKAYPEAKLQLHKGIKVFLFFYNIFVAWLALSPYMFTKLEILPNGGVNLVPGWGINFYAIGFIGFMLVGFVILFFKYRKSKSIQRSQLQYLLWGMVLSFSLLSITNFVAVNVFKTVAMAALGPPFTLILFIFTSYAVIKHRFLDIGYYAARTVVYILLLIFISTSYVVMLFALTKTLPSSVDITLISAVITVIVAFGFEKFKNLFEKYTDVIFFKGRYKTEELLFKLTQIMATELSITVLGNKLLSLMTKELRLVNGAFILIENNKIQHIEQVNFDENLLKRNDLISLVNEKNDMYVFEEIEQERIKNLFRELNISVVVKLSVQGEHVGLLVLGNKASGDIISDQDYKFLEIFAPQASIAIHNAEAYRKIQSFNETLEKKVEERTKELRETQQRELTKANELLKIKDEFVFIATHDLGAPVTAINGYIYLLEKTTNHLSHESKKHVEAIKDATERLNVLTHDLLQVARSESGSIKIDVKDVNIIQIIDDAIQLNIPSAKEHHITFKRSFHNKESFVRADAEKLSEVIENLLSNAVKYNKKNGEIQIETVQDNHTVSVTVADTGIGIDKKNFSKVFQKFSRFSQDQASDIPGTGLGLFVVRMLVEKMKGKISFKSSLGKGTSFTVTLPRSATDVEKS